MLSHDEVLEAVRRTLASEASLRWAYVFGSVARRQAYRDVDVAVMPGPTMPSGAVAFGQLIARLEGAVGCKVDLADLSQENLPFVGRLLRERIVVLDRERDARHGFEADTTSRWIDMEPVLARAESIRDQALRERLRRGG